MQNPTVKPGTEQELEPYKVILREAYAKLVEFMNPTKVLDALFTKGILSQVEHRDITDEKRTSDKNRQILKKIHTVDSYGYNVFKNCLRESDQGYLADYLTQLEDHDEDAQQNLIHSYEQYNQRKKEDEEKKNVVSPLMGNCGKMLKEGSMKQLLGAVKCITVRVKLHSDSKFFIQNRRKPIVLQNVWDLISHGWQVREKPEDMSTLQKDKTVPFLAVPENRYPKSETLRFLLSDEHDLSDWMGAIKSCIPQMLLQHDLIAHYRKHCSTLQINPLINEYGFVSNLLEVYASPTLQIDVQDGTTDEHSETTHVTSYRNIFIKNSKACQNIYISSLAGCGKTSFAKRMALSWCHAHLPNESDNKWFKEEDVDEMKRFRFLFLVYLRETHDGGCYIDTMIQNSILCDLANSAKYNQLGPKFLQDLLSFNKCLVILEGLDEWRHHMQGNCKAKNKQIPHSRPWQNCTILTTSRPWKIDAAKLKHEEIDQKLKLNGLEEDSLGKLIDNIIKERTKENKNNRADEFKLELKTKAFDGLRNIPVIVMQLLTLWLGGETIGTSLCDIYANMIAFLLKRHCSKNTDQQCNCNKEDTENSPMVGETWNKKIPKCFNENKQCQDHMELLLHIGKLAFFTLCSDIKESTLVFEKTNKYLSDPDFENCFKIGILTQDRIFVNISKRKSHVQFLHKTFQEFFAALYLAFCKEGMKQQIERISGVFGSVEKLLDMGQVLMFLSGLFPDVIDDLRKHLECVFLNDSMIMRYRSSCKLDPLSPEGQVGRNVQKLMLECSLQCQLNDHKDVYLPVTDVFIDQDHNLSELSRLKSAVINNHVNSLSVYNVQSTSCVNILNSICEFSFIKKLWLSFHQRLSATSASELLFHFKECLTIKKWKHLKCVTVIWGKNMSDKDVYSLIDSILRLQNSVKMRFEYDVVREEKFSQYIRQHSQITVHKVDKTHPVFICVFYTHTGRENENLAENASFDCNSVVCL